LHLPLRGGDEGYLLSEKQVEKILALIRERDKYVLGEEEAYAHPFDGCVSCEQIYHRNRIRTQQRRAEETLVNDC
jgi:hypothetical protein